MREKFNVLIKSCCTRTVPAAETKSIGLAANAQVSWFLQTRLDSFIMTRQPSSTYRDLVPSRQIIMTRDFSSVYRDLPARTTETDSHPGLINRSVGRAKTTPPRHGRQLLKPPGR
jgi:hypothetical protein